MHDLGGKSCYASPIASMNVVNMRFHWRTFARSVSTAMNGVILVLVLLAALVATGILFPESAGDALSGRARASDGDSIRLNGDRIRLLGIDAPELDQTCTDAHGREWQCGQRAKERMAALLSGGEVRCLSRRRDRYGRALATCTVNGTDIAATMVSEGLAVSYNDYVNEEALARASRRGIWAGTFVRPRDWRDSKGRNISSADPFQWLWNLLPG